MRESMRETLLERRGGLRKWLSRHIRSLHMVEKRVQPWEGRKGKRAYQVESDSDISSSRSPSLSTLSSRERPSTPAPTTSAPLFPKFSQLPVELRLQIWEMALFTPRVVHFNEVITTFSSNLSQDLDFQHHLISTPVPASLQICRETRDLALTHYIFSDGNLKLYLEPEFDTFYFKDSDSVSTFGILASCAQVEDLRRLKRLVIDETYLGGLRHLVQNFAGPTPFNGPAFKLLSGLEELIITIPPGTGKSRGQSALGPLFYENYCPKCREMDWWVGMDGWIFPTYQQFVTAERDGVDDVDSENAYTEVLKLEPMLRSRWLWQFVNWKMRDVCKVDFDIKERKIRACSVAGLHRFIDLLNEH